ncbi:MAG: sulfur carrier protein ThiS adenylyltransferase ThiF [Armatimonadetes bacterium]|nr:sulfur carrier protein ThiS adenylyltransferase ThiF [Armatimonadota bacterium]
MKNLEADFFSKHDPKIIPIIRNATIGIAGAGGLGSNVAVTLARVGIGKLIIADFDKIEPSNLNRQQYFIEQIGEPKVIALLENLKQINPFSKYQIHHIKLDENNISSIYKDVDIIVEAFDKAEMKKMLIETWIAEFPEKPIIAASGLAGYGMTELIHTKKFDNLYICGDEITKLNDDISPMAPRVGIVANMQANLVLELLLHQLPDVISKQSHELL